MLLASATILPQISPIVRVWKPSSLVPGEPNKLGKYYMGDIMYRPFAAVCGLSAHL